MCSCDTALLSIQDTVGDTITTQRSRDGNLLGQTTEDTETPIESFRQTTL